MRRAAASDANQPDIVKALRGAGATVQHLHGVGEGCPDLLVGYHHLNILMEVKDGAKPPSAQKLTGPQVIWHRDWRGKVYVVNCEEQALSILAAELAFVRTRVPGWDVNAPVAPVPSETEAGE